MVTDRNDLLNKINSIIETYLSEDSKKTNEVLEKIKNEEFENLLEKRKDNNLDFIYGEYIGSLIVIETLMERKNNLEAINFLTNSIPHMNEIIICINDNEGIKHTELAIITNIAKNNLTGIMGKLFNVGLVTSTSISKYRYYYLTDLGKEYAKSAIERKIEIQKEAAKLISDLLSKMDVSKKDMHYKGTIEKDNENINIGRSITPSIGNIDIALANK